MKPVRRPLPPAVTALTAAVLLLSLAACGEKKADAQGQQGAAPPPPEVAVFTVAAERIAITTELPGRIEASRIAQVRARVPGIVQKRVFREGSDVKAGDVLYRIDPAPLQATFSSTEATVSRAAANVAQADLKVKRYEPLVKENAISRQEYDDALTAQKQAQAELASAKAARQTASLNLGYATVNAPISGRVGRALVTEGALVGQGEATPLATIQQLDPVYVNLTQSSAEILQLQRAMASGQLERTGRDQAKVTLVTEDGKPYPRAGNLLFSDLAVDESTGAVTLRALFPNPDRMLLPGMYVRARLEQAVRENAIAVPQQAVDRTPQGSSVMVVGSDGKVAVRPVTTDGAQNGRWIVSSGLKSGDQVIVEGLQKVKPGAPVKTVQWKNPLTDNAPTVMNGGQPAPATANQANQAGTAPAGKPGNAGTGANNPNNANGGTAAASGAGNGNAAGAATSGTAK